MNKKVLSIIIALMFVLAMAACSKSEPAESEENVGMPNPWSDVATAEEAAKGAGIDSFSAAEGVEISLGTVKPELYRCMDGMAEARIPIAAVEMTIRKGRPETGENGDISGDYTEYKHEWTKDIDGKEVKCYGNREGEATRSIWTSGDYCYCILAQGAGGDTDFGLSEEDLEALVKAVK